MRVMREAGVIDESFFAAIKESANMDMIVDAEIVDEDQLELEAAFIEPPSFVDDYDEEIPDAKWDPEA